MKPKKLLSIINIFIMLVFVSCQQHRQKNLNAKKKEDNSINTIKHNLKKDSIIKEEQQKQIDTLKKLSIIKHKDSTLSKPKDIKKDPRLKIIIDGKVYYKKGVKDYRLRVRNPKEIPGEKPRYHKYIFVHNGKKYYIKTGKYIEHFREVKQDKIILLSLVYK